MQKIIRRKSEIREITERLILLYLSGEMEESWYIFETEILQQKVKFPLLEYVGREYCKVIPADKQLNFLTRVIAKDYEGGYVIIGVVLQEWLPSDLQGALDNAVQYIIIGDKWYACDIIAERVLGVALLKHFDESYPLIKKLTVHPNDWTKRSVGIAMHYATKKGLEQSAVEKLFWLAKEQKTNNLHVKKGYGWALKTISRYHPQFVEKYRDQILNDPEVNSWYKMKIGVGLKRADR